MWSNERVFRSSGVRDDVRDAAQSSSSESSSESMRSFEGTKKKAKKRKVNVEQRKGFPL
jgi:hypothetical protein